MFRRGRQCMECIYWWKPRDLIRAPENCAKLKTLGLTQYNLFIRNKKTNSICSKLQEDLVTQKYQTSSQSQLFAIIDVTILTWGKRLPGNISATPNDDSLRINLFTPLAPFFYCLL